MQYKLILILQIQYVRENISMYMSISANTKSTHTGKHCFTELGATEK